MIIESTLTSQIRLFQQQHANYMIDPYDAICTLTYINSATVYISGFNGNVTRQMYKEFIRYIHSKSIKKIIAERAGAKRLPYSTILSENLYELDVEKIVLRISKD